MKLKVENLGYIKNGEIELGDLTIIAGKNNTGKTYLSYTIFCILDLFLSKIELTSADFSKDKKVIINSEFFKRQILAFPKKFNSEINDLFAVEQNFFKEPLLEIILNAEEMFDFFKQKITTINKPYLEDLRREGFNVFVEFESGDIVLSLKGSNPILGKMNMTFLEEAIISEYIKIIMKNFIKPFAITSERTGISLFYKELDFTTISLLRLLKKQFAQTKDKINTNNIRFLFNNISANYAHPIKNNIDIIRKLSDIKTLSILKNNKEILHLWKNLLGGKFLVSKDNDDIYFVTNKKNMVPLYISSSASKSLLLLDFFIKKIADENSILIIDEPELNLHPEAQRYMARVLVQLVKAGIKVIITTHSDYIIRELNNLIMLSKLTEKHRKSLLKYNRYYENEYIASNMIKAYICDENTIKSVTPNKYGLDIKTFDCLINSSNKITNSIVSVLDEEIRDE